MAPKYTLLEDNNELRFRLSDINVSLANGLRRVILADIPCVVIRTEHHDKNDCTIHENTCRLHNEIVKHRLSSIPIHQTNLELLPGNYVLEVDEENTGSNIMYVTTEQFRIKNKNNGKYLTEDETHKIFPKNALTGQYIDFIRLRPKISDTIPGEKLHLTSEFSVGTSRENGMFSMVSKCSYEYTIDNAKVNDAWDEVEKKLVGEGVAKEEIEFQKKNFMLLDRQRYYVADSFDFVIETIGVYENKELVKKGCVVLQNKFVDMVQAIDADSVPIVLSETTVDNCYDIILENEDYTMGKIIEYLLYNNYYMKDGRLSFCGFQKVHPHNTESIVRVAFAERGDKNDVRQLLRTVCVEAQGVYKKIFEMV